MSADVTAVPVPDRIAVPPPETKAERPERLRSGEAAPSRWARTDQTQPPSTGPHQHSRRAGYAVIAVIVLVAAIAGFLAYRHHEATVLAQKCSVQQLTSAELGQSSIEFYLQYPQCHPQL